MSSSLQKDASTRKKTRKPSSGNFAENEPVGKVTFTMQDFSLMLESLIEHQHKLYDRSYLCRDGERREKVIVQIAETEELIKKVQKVVKKA